MKKQGFFGMIFPSLKQYRGRLVALAVVMVAAGGIDAAFPLWTRYAVDNFIVPGAADGLGLFLLLFGGMVLWQGANVYILVMLAGYLEQALMHDLRDRSFRHLQRLEPDFFNRIPGGKLLSRITSDILKIGETLSWGLVDLIWGFTAIIGIAGVMLALNWKLALVSLSVVPALVWASFYFQGKIFRSQRLVRKGNSRLTTAFNEGLMGAMTTKTLGRENEADDEFRHVSGRMNLLSVRSAFFSALYQPVVILLGTVGTALALWYGGVRVAGDVITLGTLAAFLSYTAQLFDPLQELARVFSEIQSTRAAAERVFGLLAEEPAITDAPEVTGRFGDILDPKPAAWPRLKGEVEFDRVTFSYTAAEPLLDNFSLRLEAGSTLALVGPTGAGKSTIVNLACRFYEPVRGVIRIDGRDYRDYGLACLHGNLGYVLQNPQLFSGTIRDNIAYGRLDAAEDDIIAAAKTARAH